MSHVNKTDYCWLWTAGTNHGYGRFNIDHIPRQAHRISWMIFRGPIPNALHVLHKCDVRLCVNPKHLWLGTNDDNVADRDAKGRMARGDRNASTKLRECDVIKIRNEIKCGTMQKVIAKKYGVTPSTISSLHRRIIWKYL